MVPLSKRRPRPVGAQHVVKGIIKRPQVGVDLGHEVPGEEAEAFAGLDRGAGHYYPVYGFGLQGLHGQRHGQIALPRAGGADAEGHDIGTNGIDVALLAAGLRPHRAAPGGAEDFGGEDFGRPLVGPQDVDGPGHNLGVDDLAVLEEQLQLLDEARHHRRVGAIDVELVAPGDDAGSPEGLLHGTQVLVERADQTGHEMIGDGNGYGHVCPFNVASPGRPTGLHPERLIGPGSPGAPLGSG